MYAILRDVEQIDKDIDNLKRDMLNPQQRIIHLKEKLAAYEKKMELLMEAKMSIPSITCSGFEAYQRSFEERHLNEIIENFQKALQATNGNALATMAVIVDFVTWQNENCSDYLKNKIKEVIPLDYLIQLKDLRNSLMHAVDSITRTEQTLYNSKLIENASLALLAAINCQQRNCDFLMGEGVKQPLNFEEIPAIQQGIKAMSEFPKPPGLYVDIGIKGAQQRRLPTPEEQVDIFKSVISVGKALISEIQLELKKDSEKYNLNKIAMIFAEKNLTNLSHDDILIRYKYDCLIQAFGECLGNLQQLDDTLMDLKKFNIKSEDFEGLQDIVAAAKEFRSLRAHSGYVNVNLLSRLLEDFEKNGGLIIKELDKLYHEVRNCYKQNGQLTMFDSIHSSKTEEANANIEKSSCHIQ